VRDCGEAREVMAIYIGDVKAEFIMIHCSCNLCQEELPGSFYAVMTAASAPC